MNEQFKAFESTADLGAAQKVKENPGLANFDFEIDYYGTEYHVFYEKFEFNEKVFWRLYKWKLRGKTEREKLEDALKVAQFGKPIEVDVRRMSEVQASNMVKTQAEKMKAGVLLDQNNYPHLKFTLTES